MPFIVQTPCQMSHVATCCLETEFSIDAQSIACSNLKVPANWQIMAEKLWR